QAEDGIRDDLVTGVQTCALPISGAPASSLAVGANVDVSNECGPQSETFITLYPAHKILLAAGSNELFRGPMRGYFSSDGGASWRSEEGRVGQACGGGGELWRERG